MGEGGIDHRDPATGACPDNEIVNPSQTSWVWKSMEGTCVSSPHCFLTSDVLGNQITLLKRMERRGPVSNGLEAGRVIVRATVCQRRDSVSIILLKPRKGIANGHQTTVGSPPATLPSESSARSSPPGQHRWYR